MTLSGKLVMLRVVGSTIPLSHMALYRAPVGVVANMEKLMGTCWRGEECILGYFG